jgi:hypothetical protein
MRSAILRKRRNGSWSGVSTWFSMGQGGGSVQDNQDDDTDDGDDADADPQHRIQKLSQEAARRRRQAREWRQRAEAAEAQLASEGKGRAGMGSADVVLAMVSAGMKPDRIKAALRLVDFDSYTDAEDAIEELREECPFLFGGESEQGQTTGRTAPAMNNSRQKLGRETQQQRAQRLAKRFPALGNRGF